MREWNSKWCQGTRWVLATTVGAVIGLGIEMLALGLVSNALPLYATSWILFGACVGIAQHYAWCKACERPKGWILASAGGWAIGRVVFLILDKIVYTIYRETTTADSLEASLGSFFTAWLIGRVGGGIAIRALQHVVLNRQAQPIRGWVLANSIGWNAGLAICLMIPGLFPGISPYLEGVPGLLALVAVMAMVAGVVTGYVFITSPRDAAPQGAGG